MATCIIELFGYCKGGTSPFFLLKLPNSSEFSKIYLLCCGDLLLDFSLTVKAAPHECVFRTSQL